MNINELPSNSNKSKQEEQNQEKKFESVVKGKAEVKKKSELTKFANAFVSEDVYTVKNYIVVDVIIPALKDLISSIVTNGVNAWLYGSSSPAKKKENRESYRAFYDNGKASKVTYASTTKSSYDFDDIYFDSRADAENVLDEMNNALEKYKIVTVMDYYDMTGCRTGKYTDNKYGWKDISSARVERTGDGRFVIRLPKASPID